MSTINPEEFEFRPFVAEEASAFQSHLNYMFASDETEDLPDPTDAIIPEWSHCAFHGEHLAATSAAFPFVVRVNGNTLPMQGVTMVGTDPAYRRQGLVRKLITDLLHRAYEEGMAASILLASMGAIYQRFGYGLASHVTDYRFDPRNAQLQFEIPDQGRTSRMPIADALPVLNHVFKKYVKDKNMMALRADVTWNLILNLSAKVKPAFAVHYDENDEPDAYCVYKTSLYDRDDFGPDQELTVMDFYSTTICGYRAMWQFICSHDLVGKVIWSNVPEDDPAPGILLDPRCLNRRVQDGLWLRIVDVEKLLAGRRYDVDAGVTIEVRDDDLCEWNNGRYRLECTSGQVSLATTTASPDLTCSVQGVASLVSGCLSPTLLHRNGRIAASDPAKLPQWDRLFMTQYRPHLSFGF
jgi:predicted acetyltransferase